jgi:Zn-finger nucleic acid-binding protein
MISEIINGRYWNSFIVRIFKTRNESMKPIGNDKIQITQVQEERIWIHSCELAFGKWISNEELKQLIERKVAVRPMEQIFRERVIDYLNAGNYEKAYLLLAERISALLTGYIDDELMKKQK